MPSDTSALPSAPQVGWLLDHGGGTAAQPLLLQDTDDEENTESITDKDELAAFISSGDYFGMLATRIDAISDNLHPDNEAEAMILQHIVNNLLYLDRDYRLVKKNSRKVNKGR
jgi:hypothetical protein